MFQTCENPDGCGKLAVHTVQSVRGGEVYDETEACAYCVDSIKVPRGFTKMVDGERVTGGVQAEA